jgi:RNA polymerase sigma-70 factor (ECF subfamily)
VGDGTKEELLETDDEALMQQLAQGGTTALGPLYRKYRRLVQSLVRQSLVNVAESEAEDLTQEVFIALQQASKRYQKGNSVKAYVAGIAVQKAKEQRRRFTRRAWLSKLFGRADEERSMGVEAKLQGEALLSALPEPMREVLVLHVVEGMKAEEIAATLKISVATVWTRLHRARAKLAELDGERQ